MSLRSLQGKKCLSKIRSPTLRATITKLTQWVVNLEVSDLRHLKLASVKSEVKQDSNIYYYIVIGGYYKRLGEYSLITTSNMHQGLRICVKIKVEGNIKCTPEMQ